MESLPIFGAGFILLVMLTSCGLTDGTVTPTPAADVCSGVNCPEYCVNGVHYYNGFCNENTGECIYSNEACADMCDPNGIGCGVSSGGYGQTPTPGSGGTTAATPTPATAASTPTPANTPTPVPTPTQSFAGPTQITNGDFETGTYEGWTPNDIAFGTAPSSITQANSQGLYYDSPYTGFSGNYAASSWIPTHDPRSTGTLTSDEFYIANDYLQFRAIGMNNDQLYVKLVVDGEEAMRIQMDNPGSSFQAVAVDVSAWKGEPAVIVIVDESPSRPTGYIEVDDFLMTDTPDTTPLQTGGTGSEGAHIVPPN